MSQTADDPYHLDRFFKAQDQVYGTVLDELTNDCKVSHWMWFIFPQLRGLGSSGMAQFFGISDLNEAQAYLAHPKLGPCLHVTTRLAIDTPSKDIRVLFLPPDDLKLHSSMTLFAKAVDQNEPYSELFQEALDRWFGGHGDPRTLHRLTVDV